MGRWIDAKNTPEGIRYREWSSSTDCYLTPPLTREEMIDHLSTGGTIRAGAIIKTLGGFQILHPAQTKLWTFFPGALGIAETGIEKRHDTGLRVRWCEDIAATYEVKVERGTVKFVDPNLRVVGNLADVSAEERLDRAAQTGTSMQGYHKRSLDDEWENERCQKCSSFHHEWIAQDESDTCAHCGEPINDRAHAAACT